MSAYKFLGIAGNYEAFDVPAGTLKNFLNDKNRGWTGFSLTMPLKEEVLSVADVIDPIVKRIQSGNTLVKQGEEWNLYSTDVIGFQNAWLAQNSGQPQSVLIVGSGATARTAAAAFDKSGTSITVLHRNSDREQSMMDAVSKATLNFLPWHFTDVFYKHDLVVNTTPKGALDPFSNELSDKPHGTFFDVIYNPWPTSFAAAWTKTGAPVLSGLDLLIAQGIEQIRLFTGIDIDVEELSAHLKSDLGAR
ncbi:hypothetical protein GM50_12940 [freshwater metagenome]|uniref:Shikimate dehydrogenase substrate binding N-terminal domain-containing protein n=1 Tax=freshwater metagenome TaxID=449393 RepID=A0A094Q4N2_9ZZZZ